eukprot:g25780.t1
MASVGAAKQIQPEVSIPQLGVSVAFLLEFTEKHLKSGRLLPTDSSKDGWGDRAVAAISQNIPYIGIDSNKSLKTPYKAMLNHFGGNVKMIFKRSEDISFPTGYDLIFTSPPYYNTEKYPHMKIHDTIEEFRDKYWIPTITKAHQNLEKGGHIVLNMPDYMYKMTKPILGKARKIKMPIQNRFNSKDNTPRYEYIYYWTKN